MVTKGGSFDFFLNFSKIQIFGCLAAIFTMFYTAMCMVFNGHHGGYFSTFFHNSSKIPIFGCFSAIIRSNIAQNSIFSCQRFFLHVQPCL